MTPAARIIAATAASYGVTVADMHGTKRSHRVTEARAVAAWVLSRTLEWTGDEIASVFGRDRSVVNRQVAGIDSRVRFHERLRERCQRLSRLAAPEPMPSVMPKRGRGVLAGQLALARVE